jgi:hypothetical protein
MVHIILTGATGLVGSAVLSHLLSSSSITRVSILSRSPVPAAENYPKTNVILHSDFSRYPSSILNQLRGAEACIWAQGKSSIGMTEKDYTELTHDWPLEAVKAFSCLKDHSGKRFNFVYVSGEGADQTQTTARGIYGRIKGKAEKDLLDVAGDIHVSVYNLRPAVVDGRKGERARTRLETVALWVAPVIGVVAPKLHMPVEVLARVAVELAVEDGGVLERRKGIEEDGRTVRNVGIRRLGGL